MFKIKLTSLQYGIYIEDLNSTDSSVYNLPMLYKLKSGIDIEKFKNVINELISKYPILNSKIIEENGDAFLVESETKNQIKELNWTKDGLNQKKKSLVKKFDLKNEIMSRFYIIKVDNEYYYFQDIHHILVDGYSLDIIMDDILKIYNGSDSNKEIENFDEYVKSLSNIDKNILDEEFKFYDNYLADVETDNLPLRDEYSETPSEGFISKIATIDINKLDELKSKQNITYTTFFLTVYAFLLCKYNNNKNIVINSVHNGRNENTKNTLGLFVRTFPFYLNFENEKEVLNLLHSSNDLLSNIIKNDHVNLVDLANKYSLNNDINFGYQGKTQGYEGTNELFVETERLYDETHVEQTKLLMQVSRVSDKEFKIFLSFRSDYFSDKFAECFVDSYIKVISEFLNKNDLSDIDICDENEIKELDTFFGGKLDYDRSQTIINLFEKQVDLNPHRDALVFEDVKLTYRELDKKSNIFANYMLHIGITNKDTVAILIDRNEYMTILALAVMKVGATYMPMEPTYPAERLSFMIKDSEAKLIITSKNLVDKISKEYNNAVLLYDDENSKQQLTNDNKIDIKTKPEDRMIMLYTSGTTGTPKGVELTHKNVLSTIEVINDMRKNDGVMVVAAYASFGFDANMYDTYPALTTGGTLHIISEKIRLDLYAIRDYYIKNKITHGFMTTQLGRQFLEIGDFEKLKEFGVGGEKLASIDPPKCRFYNYYGPTEASIFCTSLIVDKKYQDIPIGRINPNLNGYIVDENNKRLPIGASGELIIAGIQVGTGYLNRPDKTKEAFVDNVFYVEGDDEEKKRAYKTGDVVRFLKDGNIQYVGRRDMQVKIRGFRIELSEVEEIIRHFQGIKDVAVVAYDDNNGMKYLVAYVVSDNKIDVKALNDFIMKEKPAYMVPSITMQIDKIPLNHNQKVNKRELPKPENVDVGQTKQPTDATEKNIFDIISSVIGNKNFGIDTDFFEAGINSISLVRLNVLLSKKFNIPLKLSDLKIHNTIEKLKKILVGNNQATNTDVNVDNVTTDKYPLSESQSGIFVESVANPSSTIYNIPILLKIDDSINLSNLKTAIEKAIDNHPYIQSILQMNDDDGEIYIKKNNEKQYNINIVNNIDLNNLNALVRPFSMLNKKLYRIELIDSDKNGKYLFVDMHHIISDGMSLVVFINDINKAYNGENLESEVLDGFKYALLEKQNMKSELYENAKKYYEDLLQGADRDSLLPKDHNSIDVKCGELRRKLNIDKNKIDEFINKNNITANGFFNAVFAFVLSKYIYKEDFVYTTIYSGRDDSRLSNSMCMFVKTYPVVCKYEKGNKIIDFLKSYSKQLFDSITYSIYPFAEASRNLQVKSDVMFIYQGDSFNFDRFLNKKSELINIKTTTPKSPLRVEVRVENGNYTVFSEYRSDCYDDETINGFFECMETVANEFINKTNVEEVSLVSNRTAQLLDKFNNTDVKISFENAVLAFEASVNKNKEKIAVIAKDESITYDELNKRANKIAHSLIDMDVKNNDLIGLMIDRIANAYSLREGIMKSGGAFMSIDPKYPDDRIEYILNDSNAKYVVTKKEIYQERKELLDKSNVKILFYDDLLQNTNDANPNVDIKSTDVCYCLYTSGSTGKPKGVICMHGGAVNIAEDTNISTQTKVFTKECSVVLGLAALTFDVSVGEHMIALHNGLTVALASEDEITNPLLLCEMIIKNKVDGFTCTPSYINNMLDIEETYTALRQIKGFQVGAESFPKQLLEKIRAKGINARITNSYGPTEATVYCTTNFIDDPDNITIGTPIQNYKIFMFDKFGNLLPPRVCGEVIIAGIGVAKQYIGREDLNKEKFFEYEGLRAYKSGDLGKWNYEGKIDFLGRMDNQVKLHGLRIELDEISNVINTYPSVKQSIVVVKQNSEGEDYLAAYFIASDNVNIDDLYKHIKKYLTEYMVPQSIMQLDKFPMNVNGKVDKKALPEPDVKVESKTIKEADTDLQKTILEMFRYALNNQNIGVNDDFFKLGGTSLTASKIAMKAMTKKLPITYSDIFDYPTVAELEKLVESKTGQKSEHIDDNKTKQDVESSKKQDTTQEVQKENCDKTEVREALKNNIIDNVDNIKTDDIGDVLLTGSTGFLGIHVLKYLIDNTDKKIYCFIRKGKMSSLEAKMKNYLVYYFDDSMDDLFGKRLFLISGDITEKDKIELLSEYKFDTVINCAACVKHFANDDTLDNVNVNGVKNLIDFCVENNRRLVHVSTVSVAGETYEGSDIEKSLIKEDILYFGQDLTNKYVHTKFLAEEAILSAVTNQKLKAKIIRVGNLMSRYSDGEFQINFVTNAFMKKLKAYISMKQFSVSYMDELCEFSPIDSTAEAIVRLAATNDEFTVFEACNDHYVHMGDVIYVMNKIGFDIKVVKDTEFNDSLSKYMSDDNKNEDVSVLITYNKDNMAKKNIFIGYNNDFTTKALYRINFRWPIITEDYIEKAILALKTLGFFDNIK